MLLIPHNSCGAFQSSLMKSAEMGDRGYSNDYLRRDSFENPLANEHSVKILVHITPDDIADWRQTPCQHPLVNVMQRTTQTNWRMIDSILLAEREPPFRTVFLGSDLMLQLLDSKNGYGPNSLECEIELLMPFCD